MSLGHTGDFATRAARLPAESADLLERQAEDARRRELIRVSRAYALARRPLSSVSNLPRIAAQSAPRQQAGRWFPAPSGDGGPVVERGASLPTWGPGSGRGTDSGEGAHLR